VALTANVTLLSNTNIGPTNSTALWARTNCLVGEVLAASAVCTRCGTNLYSVLPNATACQLCPAHAACPGGDVIEPLRGHWHSQAYSALIHQCPNAAACLCAPSPDKPGACAASPCAEGYTGNACGACTPGFAATGPLKCGRCSNPVVIITLYLSAVAAVLRLMAYSAAGNWAENQTFANKQPEDGVVEPRRLKPGNVLTVFVLFVQYLGMLSSLSAPWPNSFSALLLGINWLFASANGNTLSVDCLIAGHTSLPPAIARLLAHLLAPLCMSLFLIAAFAVPWRRLFPCLSGVDPACWEVGAVQKLCYCCRPAARRESVRPAGDAAAKGAGRSTKDQLPKRAIPGAQSSASQQLTVGAGPDEEAAALSGGAPARAYSQAALIRRKVRGSGWSFECVGKQGGAAGGGGSQAQIVVRSGRLEKRASLGLLHRPS
jgi:hypothetical protein